MAPQLAFLCGKPPRTGTILADVAERLRATGHDVVVLVPGDDPRAVVPASAVDLVVHRGLSGEPAEAVTCLAARGVPLCNPADGVRVAGDRRALAAALSAAGLPRPRSLVAASWADALALERLRPVVVKPVRPLGRGEGIVASQLPAEPVVGGPYVVEEFVAHDGIDRKLYVAGEAVFGLLKPSTLLAGHTTVGEPFDPDEGLRALALAVVRAVGLHLAGVDVVIGPDGPTVVDVNPFPGYRGVDGAADAVATHLSLHAAQPVR